MYEYQNALSTHRNERAVAGVHAYLDNRERYDTII